jgi:hypothetical protein
MFRAVVCFTGEHYVTYVRAIKSKIVYVADQSSQQSFQRDL